MGKGGNKTPVATAEEKLSGDCWDANKLSKEDEWIGKLDHEVRHLDFTPLWRKLPFVGACGRAAGPAAPAPRGLEQLESRQRERGARC